VCECLSISAWGSKGGGEDERRSDDEADGRWMQLCSMFSIDIPRGVIEACTDRQPDCIEFANLLNLLGGASEQEAEKVCRTHRRLGLNW
jgi:hypothetical protein